MKSLLLTVTLLLASALNGADKPVPPAQPSHPVPSVVAVAPTLPQPSYVQEVYSAVTLLYSQDDEGGMHMHCTATAYRKIPGGYRFVTAAHCVHGDTDEEQAETVFYVTNDTAGTKTYLPAKLVRASDKESGDDFAIFEVTTTAQFSVVPLGDNTLLQVGSPVMNVAAPLGLGKQLFFGYVSALRIDRPKIDAVTVKWSDVMLVFIGGGPGSSGSAIVSDDQKAIVGLFVGGFPANIGAIVVPISKFKTFEKSVDAGTYKKNDRRSMFDKLFSVN